MIYVCKYTVCGGSVPAACAARGSKLHGSFFQAPKVPSRDVQNIIHPPINTNIY